MGRARLVWLCLALGLTGTASVLVAGCNAARELASDDRPATEPIARSLTTSAHPRLASTDS